MNLKKIQLFIELPYIRLNNLKFVECWQQILYVCNIHFATPSTLRPGAATPFAPLLQIGHLSESTTNRWVCILDIGICILSVQAAA
jgi:hypothetical protein